MKLSEAIDLLTNLHAYSLSHISTDCKDALTLAIECLKWRGTLKTMWAFSGYHKLPSEDEE